MKKDYYEVRRIYGGEELSGFSVWATHDNATDAENDYDQMQSEMPKEKFRLVRIVTTETVIKEGK